MTKLLSVVVFIVGAALLALLMPVYDLLMREAFFQGGFLAVVSFLILMLIGGLLFVYLAYKLWRY